MRPSVKEVPEILILQLQTNFWRASLDTIDFMPLLSANYSGGIIITDWYSDNDNPNESVKVSIRFLTNEIRSDALDIDVLLKNVIKTYLAVQLRKQITS